MHILSKALIFQILVYSLAVEALISKLVWFGDHGSSLYGCTGPLHMEATFCDETTSYWGCFCSEENALASLLGCLDASGEYVPATVSKLKLICQSWGGVNLDDNKIQQSFELYGTKAAFASEIPGFNMTVPVTVPVKLKDDVRELWHKAYINYLVKNFDNPVWYSLVLVWWFALVMGIATVSNLMKMFCPGLCQRFSGPITNGFRKHILMPALIGKKKNQEVSWSGKMIYMLVPSRLETLVIVVFICLVFVGLFADLHFLDNDPIFKNKRLALNRYEAIRSGIMGTMLTPLLVLFAGRNNFILWLTGWNYATNITYHKWISRISFTLILVHSITYTAFYVEKGVYTDTIKENYVKWGIAGTTVMGLLVFQAMLHFRRRWYETFVLFHVILAVFYIIGCWYHLEILGYLQLIVPAIVLWAFDRVARLIRMVIFGFPTATVTLLDNENGMDNLSNEASTLKVVIPKPKHWKMTPGGHVWIHFLKPTCFWQSHPFTCIESLDGKSIILYCKVKKGVTYNLFKYLLKSEQSKIRVAVEGPYSQPCQYNRTECVSFIAGGNGIPGIYSEAANLAKKRNASKSTVKLHWIIRDYGSIIWFYDQLEALKKVPVETTIYLTRPSKSSVKKDSSKDSESLAEKKSEQSEMIDVLLLKSNLDHITFVEGRPEVEDIIAQDIAEASKSIGFVTCGHPKMVDDIRYCVAQSLTQHKGKRIDFHEMLQVWA